MLDRAFSPCSLLFLWRCLAGGKTLLKCHPGIVRKFVDDDRGYLGWLAANPEGFVLNTLRKPTNAYLMLHLASCSTISGLPARGSQWTKDYAKICGNRAELERFARNVLAGETRCCQRSL